MFAVLSIQSKFKRSNLAPRGEVLQEMTLFDSTKKKDALKFGYTGTCKRCPAHMKKKSFSNAIENVSDLLVVIGNCIGSNGNYNDGL